MDEQPGELPTRSEPAQAAGAGGDLVRGQSAETRVQIPAAETGVFIREAMLTPPKPETDLAPKTHADEVLRLELGAGLPDLPGAVESARQAYSDDQTWNRKRPRRKQLATSSIIEYLLHITFMLRDAHNRGEEAKPRLGDRGITGGLDFVEEMLQDLQNRLDGHWKDQRRQGRWQFILGALVGLPIGLLGSWLATLLGIG